MIGHERARSWQFLNLLILLVTLPMPFPSVTGAIVPVLWLDPSVPKHVPRNLLHVALLRFGILPLGTLTAWIGSLLVDLLWHKNMQIRAVTTFASIVALNSATWIYAVDIQNGYRHTLLVLNLGVQKVLGRGSDVYMFAYISPRE